ncbi:hypothetical protein Fluta_3350 [Fluviicola taffensis DSM 16823]|uniref:Ig-like domain-containing protein n=2 Tax=Fluviicola TaxID=332102 RepID=F2IAZ8_FLUTR|nr:hypothetical protein Fluta_3350 [Fluviicola taffensis DSM 16823]
MTRFSLSFIFIASIFTAFGQNECVNAVSLTPNTTCINTTGSFSGMTISSTAPFCAASATQDVWYTFIATDATMSITLGSVSGLNHGFELIQGGCGGTSLQCINASSSSFGENYFNNNFVPGQLYTIRVFNAGVVSNASFSICVRKYPSPANDLCANATILTPNTNCVTTTGTFSGAMFDGGTPSCASGASQDVWYRFTATDSTMSISLTAESGLNHGFEVIQASCGGSVLLCVNSSSSGFGESYFNNNFIPGQVYYVRVFNVSGSLTTSSFDICVRKFPVPVNDQCVNATVLTPNTTCIITTGTFSGAMMNGGAPSCAPGSTQDLWYRFTATDSTMSISLTAESGLNHGFELLQGSCNGPVLQCVNSSSSGFGESYFNNNFIPGQVYYVRVFNVLSLNTASFGICVRKFPVPVNDQCVNATVLTPNTTCIITTGTFSGAMMNGGAPSCAPGSTQDLWYRFTATDSTMSISLTAESGLNHGFELLQGSCNGPVLQCVNSSSSGFGESYFNNDFIPGQVYYVRVFNVLSLNTASFGICVRKFPVPVNDQCVNATVLTPNTTCIITTGTFSGAMMNGGAPSCAPGSTQDLWYRFTATDSTMSISLTAESGLNHGFELLQGSCNGPVLQCVNSSSSGFGESYFNNNFIPGQVYYVRVFNVLSLNTASFGICIRKYPSPVNDQCVNATVLTPNTTCIITTGTFSGAMMNGGAPSCAPGSTQDLWYRFTATDSTMSISLTAESGLNHGFELLQGSCNGPVLQCVNSSSSGFGESYFNNNFIPGQVYYVRVFNVFSLSTTSFGICIRKYPSPVNDQCANATELTPNNTCSNISGTFSGAMMNGNTPSCGSATFQDIWYRFTATAASMTVQLSAVSGLNHGFQVFEGSCTGTEILCRNQNGSGFAESYTFTTLTIGQTYYIRVLNVGAALNTSSFSICLVGPPPSACTPTVAIHTTTTTICQGESVTFSATPTYGGTAPSYQWKINGSNVGTNNPSYTSTTLANGNSITCVMVSNATCASPTTATSNAIVMSVTPAVSPTFTVIPAICSGGSFTLPTTSNNAITGFWTPAINNTATTTYTFIPDGGQCANTATMSVLVNNNTIPVFNQVGTICSGDLFTLFTTSDNGITGTWSPAINNMATTTYTFTPNAGQCATTTTMTVTVNSSSTIPVFNQIPAICAGELVILPTTSTNGITGTWSPAINNMVTTTYTFTPNVGQCATTISMTVIVNNNVTPAFTAISPICSGGAIALPAISNNGISGTWSPSVNNTATTIYTFTPTSGQCVQSVTMTVVVNSVNTSVTNQGNTITALATAATYHWIDCATNQTINGATNVSFTPTQNGSYAVIVTQNGCSDTSNCIAITTLGLEALTQSSWRIYPNPASEQLFIDVNEVTEIILVDLTGKTIQRVTLNSGHNLISLIGLSSGVYFIRSESGAIEKFVKE